LRKDVAEDSIGPPQNLTVENMLHFFSDVDATSMHFSDVDYVVQANGKVWGRFLPSPDLSKEYPEDGHVGLAWLDQYR
jgi:hypothetical protein